MAYISKEIGNIYYGKQCSADDIDLGADYPFPDPPSIIPATISMRQAQLYLYDMGTLDAVEAIVATLSPKAQIEWRTSNDVWRSSPLVEMMRVSFGWSTADVEQMFVDASLLY